MSQITSLRNGTIPGSGAVFTLTGNSGGPVSPDGVGNINVIDATTEGTSRIVGNNATHTLTMSFTDADFNTVLGTSAFAATHTPAVAVANTGLGVSSLNAVTTGSGNTAIGFNAGASLISGINNVIVGTNAMGASTTASTNTALGISALTALDTGSGNTAVGVGAGSNYAGAESDNILIGNLGVLGESAAIHIGAIGTQTTNFQAGIAGVTVANPAFVTINTSTGQLGTTPVAFNFTYTNVTHAMSPYTVLTTDEYISVDSSGGVVTLNFPNAATSGEAWIVKDRTGSAATNNITLTTPGGVVLIDGATTFVMNTNREAINIVGNGTGYEIY